LVRIYIYMHIPSNLMLIFYILHPWDIVDYIYISWYHRLIVGF
jgi:hypothetical protein